MKYSVRLYSMISIFFLGIDSEYSGQFQAVPAGLLLGNLGYEC